MIKVFISQPMKGLNAKEIIDNRNVLIQDIKKRLSKYDVKIIDSVITTAPVDAKPMWYLGESIKMLSEADIAYFGEGYDTTRGCILEHEAAKLYGMTIMYQQEEKQPMDRDWSNAKKTEG